MCMQKCIKLFQMVYKLSTFFDFCPGTFSEFEPRHILDQYKMTFDNFLGVNGIWQSVCLDLVNSICIQYFIKIYQKVQEIGLSSLFQNLNLCKTSTIPKKHLTTSWATCCQCQCVCKIPSQYSTQFKR